MAGNGKLVKNKLKSGTDRQRLLLTLCDECGFDRVYSKKNYLSKTELLNIVSYVETKNAKG